MITLNDSIDVSHILSELDSNMIKLNEGDVIRVELYQKMISGGEEDNLILGAEKPSIDKDKSSVSLRLISDSNSGLEAKPVDIDNSPLGELFFRPNMSVIAKKLINLPPGNLEIVINKNLVLDYLVIVKNLKTTKVTSLELLSATHSEFGDVKNLLSQTDQNYVEIYPGDQINITFEAGKTSNDKTKYVLKSVGRYETGSSYVMLKGSNLSTAGNENIIPSENKLFDNYPNPFNPTTQIKYSVKEAGNVQLKIYDAIGKEVAVLVNGEKPSGTYTVNFDASKLSSGIYFYTIIAKDFYQTKKMILIK